MDENLAKKSPTRGSRTKKPPLGDSDGSLRITPAGMSHRG